MHTRSFVAATALLLAALGCRDDSNSATEPTAPTPQPTVAAATVLAFSQLSGGESHTCAVTPEYRAYCWGNNTYGQLGDGTTTNHQRPVEVATTLRFRQVSAGRYHTCGVTTDYWAYCWGRRFLGDGTWNPSLQPVAVAGGHRFRQVDAADVHTCGVTYPDNRAYCWGGASYGLGTQGTDAPALSPGAVSGGLYFKQVRTSAGDFTCGITTTNEAYCWGFNVYGQLGDSTNSIRSQPTRVAAGTRRFHYIEVGKYHTCAVTTTDRAFCWGNGRDGQLGNGKTYLSFWPRAVAGGLYFESVTAGKYHSCGVTTTHRMYCWGTNSLGQLGDGTKTQRLTPVPAAGGLSFTQASAGFYYTCGKTPTNVAYCWGENWAGQLGDGTTTTRLRPTAVVGPL